MKNLGEIILEIKELSNDLINTNLDATGLYLRYKNNDLPLDDEEAQELSTEEYWNERAEEIKQKAINFITEKYEHISKKISENNSAVSEYDYEVAYYKTFEEYFNIILDAKKTEEINKYLSNKTEQFLNRFARAKG